MAENNSKKPMALLLLVVVGVLVVLYFAGGDAPCNKVTPGSCSDGVSAEADCTGDDKTWTAETSEALEAEDEAACTTAEVDGPAVAPVAEPDKVPVTVKLSATVTSDVL